MKSEDFVKSVTMDTVIFKCLFCCVFVLFMASTNCSITKIVSRSIPEEVEGPVVVDIIRELGLQDSPTLQINKLAVDPPGLAGTFYFRSLQLWVAGRLDREALCGREEVCGVNVTAVVLRNYQELVLELVLKLVVTDQNDNSPYFNESSFTVALPETAGVGAQFKLPHALDDDTPKHSVTGYRLTNPDGSDTDLFKVVGGHKHPKLVLATPLGAGVIPGATYPLTLTATDGRHDGSIDITVTVVETNRFPPEFISSSLVVAVGEGAGVGGVVGRLMASDPDQGRNGEVRYYFSRYQHQSRDHMFEINTTTGEVRLMAPLDHEVKPRLQYTVIAVDSANQPKQAQAKLQVARLIVY